MKYCYSDFFAIDGLTRAEFTGSTDSDLVKGTFTFNGKNIEFIVRQKNYMDELYKLLLKSIRKEKLEKLR